MLVIKILQLFLFVVLAKGKQSQNTTMIKLDHQHSTVFKVLTSNEGPTHVVVGYQSGVVEYINVQNGTVSKKIKFSDKPIKEIWCEGLQGLIFVRDNRKVGLFGRDGNMLESWREKEYIIGMSVAKNESGFGFISIIHKTFISQYIYQQNGNSSEYYYNVYESGQNGTNLAVFHPKHTHMYAVYDNNSQFAVYDLSPSLTVNVTFINDSVISKDISLKDEKKPRPISYRVGDVKLKRRFNFKVKKMLVDFKDSKGDSQALILVSFDDIIYYTKQGSIYTFLPFKQQQEDQLISVDFCEKKYILTLNKHLNQSKTLYYLTYFDKINLIPEKTLEITSLFQKNIQIKSLDCNQQVIVFLTQKDQLLIIANSIEEQIIQNSFNKFQYASIVQWGITLFVFLLFICFCNKRNKNTLESEQNDQIIEPSQQKKDKIEKAQIYEQNKTQSSQKKQIKAVNSNKTKYKQQISVLSSNRKKKRKTK